MFLFFGEKGKQSKSGKQIENVRLGRQKPQKYLLLRQEFNNRNLTWCLLLFEEKERKIKSFWQKNENSCLGKKKPRNTYFYNRNSTIEISHDFSCFWRQRRDNQAFLAKKNEKSFGQQTNRNTYFYNRNSTIDISHDVSCFLEKIKGK